MSQSFQQATSLVSWLILPYRLFILPEMSGGLVNSWICWDTRAEAIWFFFHYQEGRRDKVFIHIKFTPDRPYFSPADRPYFFPSMESPQKVLACIAKQVQKTETVAVFMKRFLNHWPIQSLLAHYVVGNFF